MNAVERLVLEFEDMCGESGTEMGNDALDYVKKLNAEIKRLKKELSEAKEMQDERT